MKFYVINGLQAFIITKIVITFVEIKVHTRCSYCSG